MEATSTHMKLTYDSHFFLMQTQTSAKKNVYYEKQKLQKPLLVIYVLQDSDVFLNIACI